MSTYFPMEHVVVVGDKVKLKLRLAAQVLDNMDYRFDSTVWYPGVIKQSLGGALLVDVTVPDRDEPITLPYIHYGLLKETVHLEFEDPGILRERWLQHLTKQRQDYIDEHEHKMQKVANDRQHATFVDINALFQTKGADHE